MMQGTYRGNIKLVKMTDNSEEASFGKGNTIALRSAGLNDLPDVGVHTNDVKQFYSAL